MKVQVKATKEFVDVSPYYLYGRIVAYVGDNVVEGIDFGGKYAYLPDEVDLNIYYGD